MDEAFVRKCLAQTDEGKYRQGLNDFEGRKLHVSFFDGYGVPSNRTVFFALEGSPNKIAGVIFPIYNYPKLIKLIMITHQKKYYFDAEGKKITPLRYHRIHE